VFYVQDWADNIRVDSVLFVPVQTVDTLPPVVRAEVTEDRRWVYHVTEERNIPVVPVPCPTAAPQRESGIREVVIDNGSDTANLRVVVDPIPSVDSTRSTLSMRIEMSVIDPARNATCRFVARDWSGNDVVDSVRYVAPTSVVDDHRSSTFRVSYSNAVVNVEFDRASMPLNVSVFSIHGQLVNRFAPISSSTQHPLSLPNGLYIVVVEHTNGQDAVRLVVCE
jgi:hypothetical protein